MKTEFYTNLKKYMIAIVTLMLLANATFAQEKSYQQLEQKDRIVKNLENGINSKNLGLKRSAIYLAGKYEVVEVVPELIKQFKENAESNIRYLIAIVLYKISDQNGLRFLNNIAKYENDPKVKNVISIIILAQSDDKVLANR
ncbi:MAG: hypothetical protein KKF62_05355 [Bacteroidetes bacterium]|nr:hypothetical protein [Bacteroidota bacterium]MBU1114018.1 hypothetical protein [Bacteroidota bacterium]MBU1798966.1 hypothetical protein [Bacteroidota bacterium]